MVLLLVLACRPDDAPEAPRGLDLGPDAALGERLFRDTRLSAFYALNATDLNAPAPVGDPALDADLPDGTPNPYAGQTFACRACHLLDEADTPRIYDDFSARSAVTLRRDGLTATPRNTPGLLEGAAPRDVPFALHWDAEFVSGEDLARGAYTGRNMGWLADEGDAAAAHLAAVLRADDGTFGVAADYGHLSYADQFAGLGAGDLTVSRPVALDGLDDDGVLDAIAAYTAAYLDALVYARDADGAFSGSAYDRFLAANGLPRAPDADEDALSYARRLRSALPTAAPTADFDTTALAGLRVFLAEPASLPPSGVEVASGGFGNCVACHPPPAFTDYALHGTAVAEATYDRVHDADAFLYYDIPGLAEREADPAAWLPPSADLPDATGRARAFPVADDPTLVDLGAWNILFNPARPLAQEGLRTQIVAAYGLVDPTDEELLTHAVGLFKTPTLRNLAVSAPYFHDGSMADLEAVLRFYRGWTPVARDGFTVNPDPRFLGVALEEPDVAPLLAFLATLAEPYP